MITRRANLKLRLLPLLFVLVACAPAPQIEPTQTPAPSETPSPTPSPTPTATVTPTPSPRDALEEAERARFNGDWETALASLEELTLEARDANLAGEARLAIGRTYLDAGRYEQAIEVLDEFIAAHSDHTLFAQSFFMRARAHEALDHYAAAAQDYERYLEIRPGFLDGYVYTRLGDALRQLGDLTGAQTAYLQALSAARRAGDLSVELRLASTYAALNQYGEAFRYYEQVYEQTESDALKAQMDYLMGRSLTALGELDQAHLRYLDAVENYPQASDAYNALVLLVEDGVAVSQLDRGIVDYYAGQYGVAMTALDRYLAAQPEERVGEAHYFRGLTMRAMGDLEGAIAAWDQAIEGYTQDPYWDEAWEEKGFTLWAYLDEYDAARDSLSAFVVAAPAHPRAAEFLFDAGLVAEWDGELEEAASLWRQVAESYPESNYAFRGAYMAGIAWYRLGYLEQAAAAFRSSLAHIQADSERASAYLWLGKTAYANGEASAGEAAWRLAADADRGGYYSLRAEDLLADRDPFETQGVLDLGFDERAERLEAEAWLRTTFAIEASGDLSAMSPELAADPHVIRGQELWALGLFGEAKLEFDTARDLYGSDALAVYQLMHKLLDLGLYQPAIYASKQIIDLANLNESTISLLPEYLQRIRFGPYFADLILPIAEEQGLDPLFLFSVVRQESLFESFATSYAAARGLMQILTSTGAEVAAKIGWPVDFEEADLYRPIVSVRLGSQYLADQRDYFGGDLYAALAAYNAGPGNSLAWVDLAPDDPDLFLEVIRFQQPRDYIRVIYWAHSNYRRLYTAP